MSFNKRPITGNGRSRLLAVLTSWTRTGALLTLFTLTSYFIRIWWRKGPLPPLDHLENYQEIPEKWLNVGSYLGQKTRSFSASGGLRPWPPNQGLCPWTSLGAPPPDPVISSRSRARHPAPAPLLNSWIRHWFKELINNSYGSVVGPPVYRNVDFYFRNVNFVFLKYRFYFWIPSFVFRIVDSWFLNCESLVFWNVNFYFRNVNFVFLIYRFYFRILSFVFRIVDSWFLNCESLVFWNVDFWFSNCKKFVFQTLDLTLSTSVFWILFTKTIGVSK